MSGPSDLIFVDPAGSSSGDLVFGASGGPVGDVVIAGTLPGLAGGLVTVRAAASAAISGTLPGLAGGLVHLQFDSRVDRPLSAGTRAAWQEGIVGRSPVAAPHHQGFVLSEGPAAKHAEALPVAARASVAAADAERRRSSWAPRHAEASRGPSASTRGSTSEMLRDARARSVSAWSEAAGLRRQAASAWQERIRTERPAAAARWQQAVALFAVRQGKASEGLYASTGRRSRWEEARRPPPGVRPSPPGPGPSLCYTPSPHLVFSDLATGPYLVFACEASVSPPPGATVVVPVRSVYMSINNVFLRRVSDGAVLPAKTLRMTLDADSWTWSFSASLQAAALAQVDPGTGDPIELEAMVNGSAFRLLAERISRDRDYRSSSITVGGRGKNAMLADPYAPVLVFASAVDRTAAQLMDDALLLNGVSIGWGVAFGLDDWLVPGGVWSHQGTHLSAVQAIAAAAGGYLQPHRTSNILRALPRYPSAPWDWGSVTPDFDLPADVVSREGIEWVNRPAYNRVFVSGSRDGGILGQVTRAGTAGDFLAPMVTDPLITEAAAAGQRGRAILGNTGRQAAVTLRLPVLSETGVIEPGAFVRYLDGSTTRLGLVRSTSVDFNGVTLRQSIGVETHVD